MNSSPRRIKQWIPAFAGVLLLLPILGCGGEPEAARPEERVTVVTEAVLRGEVREAFEAIGTTKPKRDAGLAAEVLGRVTFLAPEGSILSGGQTVARLDPVQASATVNAASSQHQTALVELRRTERDLERTRRLVDAGAQPRQALDDAESAREAAAYGAESARANLSEARAALGKNVIAAPFRGEVLIHHTEVGEIVSQGSPIARFGDLNTLEIEVTVGERAALSATTGSIAHIYFDALPSETYATTVARVDRALSADARTTTLVLELPNPARRLLAGMLARVALTGRAATGALIIPKSAVQFEPDGIFVWTVENERAVRKLVTLGIEGTEQIEILSGLREGERVVTRGTESLTEGVLVDAPAAV